MSYYRCDEVKVKPSREVFKNYLVAQAVGDFNMLSEEARASVGCSRGEYAYIIENYDSLCEEYGLDLDSPEVEKRVNLRLKWGF